MSWEYRKDGRSDDQTEKNILEGIEKEEKYVWDFVNSEKDKNWHHRWLYIPWGNGYKKIDKTGEDRHLWDRPDYILLRKQDNSLKIRYMCPLEVDNNLVEEVYYEIKPHKLNRYFNILYDKLTKSITSNEQTRILYVINTVKKGYERYTLLEPKQIQKIIKRGTTDGKYIFYHKEVKWFDFNDRTKQTNLKEGKQL